MLKQHEKYFNEYCSHLKELLDSGKIKHSTYVTLKSLIKKWLDLLEKNGIKDLREGLQRVKLPYQNSKIRRFVAYFYPEEIPVEGAIRDYLMNLRKLSEEKIKASSAGSSSDFSFLVGKVVQVAFSDGEKKRAEVVKIDTERNIVELLPVSNKGTASFILYAPLSSIKYFSISEDLVDVKR